MLSSRALPDVDRDADLLEGEPPRVAEDPVVLHAALGALAHRLADEGQRVVGRPPLGQHRAIGRGERAHDGAEQPGVAGVDDAHLHEGRRQPGRPPGQEQQHAVLDAQPAGRAVEVERDRAREERRRRDAVAHLGRADGGVGTAGRPAHDGEPLDAQRLGEVGHVGRPVDETASRLVGREAHAGPVGGDAGGRPWPPRPRAPAPRRAGSSGHRGSSGRGSRPGRRTPRRPAPARRAGVTDSRHARQRSRARAGDAGRVVPGSVRVEQVPAREHAIGCGHESERRRAGGRPAGRLPAGDDAAAAVPGRAVRPRPGLGALPARRGRSRPDPEGPAAGAVAAQRRWRTGGRRAQPHRLRHVRAHHRHARDARAEGALPAAPLHRTRRSGASSSASRARAPTWPGCRPAPSATARSGCSTGRRSGPPWRTSPRSASSWRARTPTSPSTRG